MSSEEGKNFGEICASLQRVFEQFKNSYCPEGPDFACGLASAITPHDIDLVLDSTEFRAGRVVPYVQEALDRGDIGIYLSAPGHASVAVGYMNGDTLEIGNRLRLEMQKASGYLSR